MSRTKEQRQRYRFNYESKNPEIVRELKRLAAARRYEKDPQDQYKRTKAWRAANPEAMRDIWRNSNFLRAYGITTAQRDEMLVKQGNKCASCGTAEPGSKRGWHVDHCHRTLKIRGIVCHHCNSAAGHAKDDPARLRLIADYLEKHK